MFIVYLMLFIYFLYLDIDTSMEGKYKLAANIQLQSLVEWARHIPHFNGLSIDDQVVFFKGTVSVISRDPLGKNENVRFKTIVV